MLPFIAWYQSKSSPYTHPEQALAIYQAAIQTHLPHADTNSYEAAAGYLRKLRPILKSLEREDEWSGDEMVATNASEAERLIRKEYRKGFGI